MDISLILFGISSKQAYCFFFVFVKLTGSVNLVLKFLTRELPKMIISNFDMKVFNPYFFKLLYSMLKG